MSLIRTFVAVETPPAVRAKAGTIITRLAASGASVKWIEPDKMHVTLKFIGEVPHGEIADVCRAVQEAARPFTPFSVAFEGVGAFPSVQRPRTLWVKVDAGAEQMELLHEAIDQALDPMGYPPERRKFHPHLTLGRVRGSRGAKELGERLGKLSAEPCEEMVVEEVQVFASQLDRRGPTYDILSRAPLEG